MKKMKKMKKKMRIFLCSNAKIIIQMKSRKMNSV